MKGSLSSMFLIRENVRMPTKNKSGNCDGPRNARKAYKEIVKTRTQIAKSILPLLRKVLHVTAAVDRATSIIATELRKQQLDENGS